MDAAKLNGLVVEKNEHAGPGGAPLGITVEFVEAGKGDA
jgi:hypothetical protein